jgi:hypothetical protein
MRDIDITIGGTKGEDFILIGVLHASSDFSKIST